MTRYFDDVDDIPFKVLRQGGLSPFERTSKRIMDVLIASAMLAVSLPFFPIICLAIRLNSPGPAIFRHQRIGNQRRAVHDV